MLGGDGRRQRRTYCIPSIVTYPPCQPSPWESTSVRVCKPAVRHMACVDSADGVTFAYVPLCEYAFRILEHLCEEDLKKAFQNINVTVQVS